jgi:hypothetical protein
MRYCYNCSLMTLGQPRFCNFCGRSYDVKLCPRLHDNTRESKVCSECGSRELSTPQPKLGLGLRVVQVSLSVVPGVVLLLASVMFFIVDVYSLFTHPVLQFRFMLFGLALGLVWFLYIELMEFFRRKVRRRVRYAPARNMRD